MAVYREPEPDEQPCYTNYGSLLPKEDDRKNPLRDIRENILLDERLNKYKGVYAHYGEKAINNAAFEVPVLNKSLIPVWSAKAKPAGQDWAISKSRDGQLHKCFTSEHAATGPAAAECHHAIHHMETEQPKAIRNEQMNHA